MTYNKKGMPPYRIEDKFRRDPFTPEFIEEEIIPSFLRHQYGEEMNERNASPYDKRLVKEHMHKHFDEELDEAEREEEGEEDVEERDSPEVSEDTIDYITFRVLQNVKKYLECRDNPTMDRPKFKIEIGM